MTKLLLIKKIKSLYSQGLNILEFLKNQEYSHNDAEAIMISYDFQAGSYTKSAAENIDYIIQYTDALQKIFNELPSFSSIMEVGVGEATVMNPLMLKIDPDSTLEKFGFDISWSRSRYALQNAQLAGNRINFFVANLFEIPFPDNSIDIVYTSHSLEPNGGMEKEAIKELYRVAKRYVILLEPDFQSATVEGRERMIRHGYVQNLASHANELGYDVICSRPFDISINPLNPTGLTILKKHGVFESETHINFICPVSKTALIKKDNVYYSAEGGLIYPIIDGLPCFLSNSAILGLHFSEFARLK